MSSIPTFIQYNGRWDDTNKYVDYEMSGILLLLDATYDTLIDLIMEALDIRGQKKSLILKYVVEVGMTPVKIKCDRDVFFYVHLKNKDTEFNKFLICVNIVDVPSHAELEEKNQESVSENRVDHSAHHVSSPINIENHDDCGLEDNDQLNDMFGCNHVQSMDVQNVAAKNTNVVKSARRIGATGSIDTLNNANSICALSPTNCDLGHSSASTSNGIGGIIDEQLPSEIKVKNIYMDKKLLKFHMHRDALLKRYQFKVKRSRTDLLHLICMDDACKWQMRATKLHCSDMFVVKRFDDTHTCRFDIKQGHHRQASSWMIGELIKGKYVDIASPSYKPYDIIRNMHIEFGVIFGYHKAWRVKEAALASIYGPEEGSYQVLPSWSHVVMQRNPGSDIHLVTDHQNRFKYFFMCLAASKQGWPHCRPVIVVDGFALKAQYGGILLSACTLDADNSIFPLAFGVVDVEDDASWEWFFCKLKESIENRDELAIVADRNPNIKKAALKVFTNAEFGICTYRLWVNLQNTFRKFEKDIKTYYDRASMTYLQSEFLLQMENINKLNPEVKKYLVEANPESWSRAFFNGKRYSIMTTDIIESFNNVDKKVCLFPVGFLVEWLRGLVQMWHYERREAASKLTHKLASIQEKIIHRRLESSISMTAQATDHFRYDVRDPTSQTWLVNIEDRTCTCRQFQVDQLPCAHVLSVCNKQMIDPSTFCARYYTVDALRATYEGVVYPIGSPAGWIVPEDVRNKKVEPPLTK